MICPWCNAENDEQAAFCNSCGKLLPEPEVIAPQNNVPVEESNVIAETETAEVTGIIEQSETAELLKKQDEKIVTTETEIIRNTQTVISGLSDNLKKQKRVTCIILAVAIALFFSTIGTGVLAYQYYIEWSDLDNIQSKLDNVQSKYDSLTNRFNSLTDNYNSLKKKYDTIADAQDNYNDLLESDVFVRVTKVYNDADNSTDLDHTKITYLDFDYTVSKSKNIKDSETLYIKIINPDGSLRRGSNSPSGYTISETVGSYWNGWGSKSPGSYNRGYHTIEFWYNYHCVGKKRFYIN